MHSINRYKLKASNKNGTTDFEATYVYANQTTDTGSETRIRWTIGSHAAGCCRFPACQIVQALEMISLLASFFSFFPLSSSLSLFPQWRYVKNKEKSERDWPCMRTIRLWSALDFKNDDGTTLTDIFHACPINKHTFLNFPLLLNRIFGFITQSNNHKNFKQHFYDLHFRISRLWK